MDSIASIQESQENDHGGVIDVQATIREGSRWLKMSHVAGTGRREISPSVTIFAKDIQRLSVLRWKEWWREQFC